MPINFIPNDPLAIASLPIRQKAPRPNRPGNRAGFNFFNAVGEGLFNPGTPEFLFWQCREAALLSMEVWESLNGNLTRWGQFVAPDRSKLDLVQDGGVTLNAFYDRQSLSFFHNTTGNKTTFSGASTDVVAHESGHGFLDTMRPELFGSNITEHGAFHEAFGDCVALLVAFSDQDTRTALLDVTADLGGANFVEATAEDLSDGVRRALGANHPAAAPRQAFNNFQFQLPTTLPTTGRPAVLTSEIHSFGRIFSGCFYDIVRNIFAAFPNRDQATLLKAAQTAGRLLIAGAQQAPLSVRYFQSVGRAMVLADQNLNGDANRLAITNAFARHGIALGSAAMLAPRASLAGPAPKLAARAKGPILSAATSKDIKRRIAASPAAKLVVNAVNIGGEEVAEALHNREVALQSLSGRLKGVVALAPESVLVGASGAAAAVVSALPDPNTTTDEVHKFVETLLAHNRIAFEGDTRRAAASSKAVVAGEEELELPTHTIRSQKGKKILTRIRFLCHDTD
jgi:hypothetical protein